MSLVGPRPCIPYETEHFEPHHFERFLVPAGHHRALAGDGARALDVRRGARHGRRVRPRLVARPRSPSAAAHPPVLAGLLRQRRRRRGMSRTCRVGVVGLGYWGPNLVRNLERAAGRRAAWRLRQAPRALDADRAPLSRRRAARREFERRARRPGRRGGRDRDAGRARTTSSRSAALAAGKHVFVEKPLAALARGGARARAQLAEERGLVLMPGHTFLYSPPVQRDPRPHPRRASSATSTSSR